MPGIVLFCAGVVASLAASWLLVSRLERLGERAGFSEAWLGLVAALAADAPEITSAVTALARGQASVAAGVVIGSNVFNLAALLGLAAVVAGWIGFHRRVVVLSGVPAVWVAAVCLLTVAAVVAPAAGLALAAVVLVPYVAVLGMRRARMERLRLPARWVRWLVAAVHEEETELAEAIRPRPGTWRDAAAAMAALITVIGASTVMEVAATAAGRRYAVPDVVTGGLVLAEAARTPAAVSHSAITGRGASASISAAAPAFGSMTVMPGSAARAATSPSCHGVPTALIRTMVRLGSRSRRVRATSFRARFLFSGATASSRSRMTASAAATALPNRSGRSPGQNRSAGHIRAGAFIAWLTFWPGGRA